MKRCNTEIVQSPFSYLYMYIILAHISNDFLIDFRYVYLYICIVCPPHSSNIFPSSFIPCARYWIRGASVCRNPERRETVSLLKNFYEHINRSPIFQKFKYDIFEHSISRVIWNIIFISQFKLICRLKVELIFDSRALF